MNPDALHIRDATPDDAAVVAAIYNESIVLSRAAMDSL